MHNLILLAATWLSFTALGESAIIERGPHHNVVQTLETVEIDGETLTLTNRYTEIGSGLNFWDGEQNAWMPSTDEVEMMESGAAYQKGPYQLFFTPNINANGNLRWRPAPDKQIVIQTLGIVLVEEATGDSVWLGQIKDTQGFLTARNEVTYPSCFDQIDADVRISVTPHGFENDVILKENVADPAVFGFQGPCRLEIWHSFVEGPEPQLEAGGFQRGGKTEIDTQLKFDAMHIGSGTAFLIGQGQRALTGAEGKSIRVAKEYFVDAESRQRILIEGIPLAEAQAHLQTLPASRRTANVDTRERERLHASRRNGGQRQRPLALQARPAFTGEKIVAMGRKSQAATRGFLMDFSSLVTVSDKRLQGDTTYVVATNTVVNLSGTTVLEPGCVIKFGQYNPTNNTPIINLLGPLDCATRPYAPAVFTSREDRTAGETNTAQLASIATNAYGAYHLCVPASNTNAITLHDVRSRYALNAFGFLGTNSVEAWNIQVISAQGNAFEGGGNIVTLRNVLANNVNNLAVSSNNNTVFKGEHFTIHTASKAFSAGGVTGCSLNLTNSLLVVVTNSSSSGFTNTSGQVLASDSGVFQTVGSGAHYLTDDSPYRNKGATNISTNLTAGIFKYSTTYPPLVLSGNFASDTILYPYAPRDTDLPDLGYHYASLDYGIGGLSVNSGVTLTLTNGVAIAGYDLNALTLNGSSKLICEGSPANLNRIVRSSTVQEQASDWGAVGATMRLIYVSGASQVSIRFTEAAHLAYSFQSARLNFLSVAASSALPATFSLRDSEIYSSNTGLAHNSGSTATANILNNLFHRSYIQLFNASATTMNATNNNNLVRYGYINFSRQGSGSWVANNNLFDHCAPSVSYNSVANSNNAYETGATAMSGAANTTFVTAFDFQTGVLGPWYYPTAGGNLSSLIDAGTGAIAAVGLAHFTVRTDHTKDTGNIDIGRHYAAMGSDGPLDSDSDGIPDYLEDKNGNGSTDAAESSMSDADSDNDGLNDGIEWSLGFDPNVDQASSIGSRRNITYDRINRVTGVSGTASLTIGPDNEGNIQTVSP